MDFLTLAKNRYSCRKMSEKPVEQEKIDAIIEAARLAPTAKNLQPFKIWVMQSEEAVQIIHEITSCTFGAPVFFVVGAKKEEAWVRPSDHANFCHVDASIVATHMMLEIEELGLNTTWVGFFDAPALQEKCPEMKEYDLVAIFPVGYGADDAAPSPRHTQRKEISDMVSIL